MADTIERPSVYVETTLPSYLTALPSRDMLRASHQQVTKNWWAAAFDRYDLAISPPVLEECQRGDAQASVLRLQVLSGITVLGHSEEAIELSIEYIKLLKLPAKAVADALHIAYATVYELDYLLTWNMRHLASSLTMRRLTEYNVSNGLHVPLIVTPESLQEAEKANESDYTP